jgi:acyl carrier protein
VLPGYMIPAQFIGLDALPLTPTGKIDRRALPAPENLRDNDSLDLKATAADMTPMEAMIARLWQETLGLEGVTVYDNFFDLGGHSLQVMQIMTKMAAETGYKLDPAYMRLQTLGQLAATYETFIAGKSSLPVQEVPKEEAQPEALGRKLFRALKRAVQG